MYSHIEFNNNCWVCSLAKYCNPRTKIAVIKVRHGPHEMVLKALPKINKIGGIAVRIKILYTGATLKHCFLFIKVS